MDSHLITHATPLRAEKHTNPARNTRNIRNTMLTWSEIKEGFQERKSETAKKRTDGGRVRNIARTGKVPIEQQKSYANPANIRDLRNTRNRVSETKP